MSIEASFPGEPWTDILLNLIPTSKMNSPTLLSEDASFNVSTEFTLSAIFQLYDANGTRSGVTLRCILVPCTDQNAFTTSRTFARIMSDAINDMDIRYLSASIHVRNELHNSDFCIANMERLLLFPGTQELEPTVSPSIYRIIVKMTEDPTNNASIRLSEVTFIPELSTFFFFSSNI